MDKANTFRSSNFYMSAGDVLHMIIRDESGTAVAVELYAVSDPNNPEAQGYGDLMDYDGNIYTTVVIGTQEWIVENLRVTHYSDGSAIANITNAALWLADTTGAYCWYDNDEATYKDTYGALYNGYAITNSSGLAYLSRDGAQESGWRVPTLTDLETLQSYLSEFTGGSKLKQVGTGTWTTPNNGAVDIYGFNAVPGGERKSALLFPTGAFDYIGEKCVIAAQTISELLSVDHNATMVLEYDSTLLDILYSRINSGFSVRLVRDIGSYVTVNISVSATPGFEISSESGYAVIGESTIRVTFYCDAFPVVGGGAFTMEIKDAGSNVLYYVDGTVESTMVAETGVLFDSNEMVGCESGIPLSRALITGDVLTVTLSGAVA